MPCLRRCRVRKWAWKGRRKSLHAQQRWIPVLGPRVLTTPEQKLPPQATHGISAGHHRGCQPVAKPFGNRDRSCLGSSELVKREKADLNTGDHFFLFLGTIESKRLWAICSLREDAKLLEPCELHRVFRALCPPHWYRAAYRPHSALCMSRGCWTLQVFGMLGHFIFFILT